MEHITTIIELILQLFNNKRNIQQKEYQWKRKQLNAVYEKLVSAIEQYPEYSPNDILSDIDLAPHYSMENFDSVLKSLDYQIEDYKKLRLHNCSIEQQYNIDIQIHNREYAKKQIAEIQDTYYKAKEIYNSFCKSDLKKLNLYAGQDVKNRLVEFNVHIKNVFLSGQLAECNNSMNSIIKVSKQNLIISMRKDIGIF